MKRFKWLTGTHYKMERFGIMFCIIMFMMCLLMGSIFQHKRILDANTLGDQVLYTTSVSMSLSGNTATVEGVYIDSEQTEVFILLKWENPSMVVSNAANYELYLCGSDIYGNYEKIQSNPLGQVYMFGSTGYMGIYLTDAAGFPTQVLRLVGRCDKTLTVMSNVPTYADSTFNEFDQFNLYFNPGASGFIPAEFLDADRMGLYDIYQSTVLAGQEEVIKEQLEADLTNMQAVLARIDEYEKNINDMNYEGARLLIPDEPVEIRGDRIVEDADGNLELDFVTMLGGGFDLDWRNCSLAGAMSGNGYVETVLPEGETSSRWLSSQLLKGTEELRKGMSSTTGTWYWSDGRVYTGENEVGLDTLTNLETNRSNLVKAWSEYYNLKYDYQVMQQYALLQLEVNAMDVVNSYSVKADDVVHLW